ncbi:MAG: hypothetical protein JSR47_18910 [Proteobacteria bacterium]|nr:hypothetical protein [Pseudomonadota bacterium]
MDTNSEMFVQAFWVKCREAIRPEIDAAADDLRRAGHDAAVSTQEYSTVPDRLPAAIGPSLTLALRPRGPADGVVQPAIEFHGDVAHGTVEVRTSAGHSHAYALDRLDTPHVKSEIEDWLGHLITASPV